MEQAIKTPRVLTVVEGREENKQVIVDLKNAAKKRDWRILHLKGINSDELARFDFKNLSLEYVLYRDLSNNNFAESERLIDYLKNHHAISVNLSATGGRAVTSDKHYQQGLFLLDPILKEYALPTFEAKSNANVMSYVDGKRVSFPIVLKDRYGTAGKNITLVHNRTELNKISSFKNLLIEQYIEAEHDWRVFVIGGTAVGIMKKVGDPNHPEDFIAWSAGRSKSKEEDEETRELLSKIACRAASVSRLEYTGVDIIQDKNTKKFYILETNYAAGWMNRFIPTTGVNIPDCILDWFEDKADARKQKTSTAVKRYINKRMQFLSKDTINKYNSILAGEKNITKQLKERFKYEETRYLYNTGSIFKKLAEAYENITEGRDPKQYQQLISEIEQMPLSWAGNFIGPEVGTLEDGAILSALYLFILDKTKEVC